jgi:hypothetical protein
MSPAYFWRCTPKKFNTLCKVHARLNSSKKAPDKVDKNTNVKKAQAIPKQPDTYIDKIM